MTPKELENLVHQYNMDGELDVTCIGSLYSTFKGDWGIPTLLYLGGDEPNKVYISRTVYGEKWNGKLYFYGDIPPSNPDHLTMVDGYKCYSIDDDEGIKKAVANLSLQFKQCFEKFKLEEIKKDFENGTNEN